MKKVWTTVLMGFLVLFFSYSQSNQIVFKAGDSTNFYPVGVEAIFFKGNTPYPIISWIKKINDDIYELSFTVVALSNTTADGTYPIVVSYCIKEGSILEMKTSEAYSEEKTYKLRVVAVDWNIVILEKIDAMNSSSPNPSKDTL